MNCSVCTITASVKISSSSKFSANISSSVYRLNQRLSSTSKLSPSAGIYRNSFVRLSGAFSIRPSENMDFSPKEDLSESAVGKISSHTIATLGVKERLAGSTKFDVGKVDKFSGKPPSFVATSKLYPIGDISFKNKFTNQDIDLYTATFVPIFNIIPVAMARPAYQSLDEGVFANNYTQNNKNGSLLSDDNITVVFPNQVFNSGDLTYKLRVTYPLANPQFSYLALRAYAPFDNYVLRRPQQYKIYDIKLEDPSGNLIIKYEDINIKGDNHFVTYISSPTINNASKTTWSSDFPYMDSGSPLFLENKPYTLTLNFSYDCSQYPFDNRFGFGYERTCISGVFSNIDDKNPFYNLLISSIEIGNSGGVGIKKDNYINCFTQVRTKSERTKKVVLPSKALTTNFNNGIYPEASSIWRTPDYLYSNQNQADANVLLNKVAFINSDLGDFITMSGSVPFIDSGRLILKFDGSRDRINKYTDGAFNFGGSKSFNDAKIDEYIYEDYFDIDSVELRVIAKKASGGSNYNIDVVGYSDDKLLYVTSPIGGFLQNSGSLPFNETNVPNVSGLNKINFGFSNSSISDQSEYFDNDISPLGDHYIVNNSVTVNSTEFEDYIVPLQIYQDPRKLGYTSYSLSSYFENLYIDICPIPSGASIAHVSLILYYKPANALSLHTLGSPSDKKAIQKSISLLPSGFGTIVSTEQVSGIPIAFSSPSHLASNFSRRWRGHTGDVLIGGDFYVGEFDFSFNHKQSDTPFLTSYVDFKNTQNLNILDHKGNIVGQSSSPLNILSNFGWRYSSQQLFDGITTQYKSLSWQDNIFDSFDRAMRISSLYDLVINNPFSISNSFAFSIRFTPDNISQSYLNNNVIFSYENGEDWSMALVCENSFLTLKIKDSDDNIIDISDTISINDYNFPLTILITYDDDGSNKFKLYTDNDLELSFNNLRGSATVVSPMELISPSMRFGHMDAYIYPNAMPLFLHEIGYSNNCNIIQSNPNRFLNEISAKDLFDSYKVNASYIDDDISKWRLGAFKICSFSSAFDYYTKREGKDYITFNLKHSGSGYSQITDKTLPSTVITSGVSYHTQIENDFLRYEISNIPSIDQNRFYAISPRISKNLPKGYNFKEETLCVDTILEHETNNDILWPDNSSGPKLIVSLYSPSLESPERPDKMFGLINRSIHTLEPSGCIQKITSKFTFDDLLDVSQPWALFDSESYNKEFQEKYFLNDVNSMRLQYDLVYPSGASYSSKIRIHNSHIRVDNAIYFHENSSGILPLYVDGEKYQFATMNLFAPENGTGIDNTFKFNLYVGGRLPIQIHESGLKLFVGSSGYYTQPEIVNLYTAGNGIVSSQQQVFSGLFGSTPLRGMSLSISGQLMRETILPLHTYGMAFDVNNSLNLVNFAQEGSVFLENSILLKINGINRSFNAYPSGSMSLHVYNNQEIINDANNSLNLYVSSFNPNLFDISGSLPLVTLNYPISDALASSSAVINWDSNNVGQGITSVDNIYAYVDADDNIRGVNLACYGDCNT